MTELERLLAEKGAGIVLKVNQIRVPTYALDNTAAGAHEFNIYYQELLGKGWNTIVRTKSRGISVSRKAFKPPMWDVRYSNACIELTVITNKMLRIQFRQTNSVLAEEENISGIYGRQAFVAFKKELLKDGINLDTYVINNGPEVKKTISKYLIKMEKDTYTDLVFEGCHHVDFHSSFPAGLANTHPEFAATLSRLYEERKEKPINKAILNYSIGFCQSIDNTGARWAHLSRDAIADNNKRIEDLAKKLRESGRLVISYNTDGIWYKGDIYHGEGEGKRLGEWENDHTNCKFRAKSAGAYEFVEDGKYFPVVRGRTNYDLIKPRTQWEWGDIYKKEARPLLFFWIAGKGIVDKDNELL